MSAAISFNEMDADELRDLLDKSGLSYNEAARELGIARRTLGYYLTGRRIPAPTAFAIRTVFSKKRKR